jgi:putative inorganic carbon (HCO3(-)) transporter
MQGVFLAEVNTSLRRHPPLARAALVCLAGFLFFSSFSISLSQIFVFTGIPLWLLSVWKEPRSVPTRFYFWKPFAIFVVLTSGSAFFSDDMVRSLKDVKQISQIFIFYFAVNIVADEREAHWLVKVLLAAAALASIFTLGFALMRPIGLANRMSGFFSIYMTLGGYLVIAGALAFAYLIHTEKKSARGLAGVTSVIIIAALMTTFSRNAWVGFGAAVICTVVAARSVKGMLFIVVLAISVVALSPPAVRSRILSIGDTKDPSTLERMYMWQSGLNMVRDRPVFGTGLDMIKRTYTPYANPKAMKKRTGHLHNNMLHIAVERGLPALASWIWIMAAFFMAALKRMNQSLNATFESRYLPAAGLAAVTGFFVAGLFEYNFGDSEVVMLAYFAMALPFMGAQEGAPTGGGRLSEED